VTAVANALAALGFSIVFATLAFVEDTSIRRKRRRRAVSGVR